MSKEKRERKFNAQPKAKARRSRVIARLEDQLKKGTKAIKKETTKTTELADSDIKRIEKELATLKARI